MYLIFYDESGKIDRNLNTDSYYGALGCTNKDYNDIKSYIKNLEYKTELHFTKFNLKHIERYLKVINYVFQKDINLNVYLVDIENAKNIANRLNLSMEKLRELFYIKIPERLIYGILRDINEYRTVRIIYDRCDEYENYNLKDMLSHQLNAQAVYRNLNCQITRIKDEDSKEESLLQVIDILLGIVTLLIEKKYYLLKETLESKAELEYILNLSSYSDEEKIFLKSCYSEKKGKYKINCKGKPEEFFKLQQLLIKGKQYSKGSIMKAEFLYRLMDNPKKIERMKKLCLYYWNGSHKVNEINIGDYIAEFFHFKTKYDEHNKLIILRYHKVNTDIEMSVEKIRKILGFGSTLDKLCMRYKSELEL